MTEQNTLQQEVAQLLVDALNLEIKADAIEPTAVLFGDEGLGLDSIDALEIAYAISRKYNIQLRSDDENVQQIFSSLAALSEYIAKQQ